MSNYHLQPADKPQALTPQALRSLRQDPVQGISRRTLLRRSIGGATLLWLTEVAAGSIGFLWPNSSGGFGSEVEIGTIDDIKAAERVAPVRAGLPGLLPAGPRVHRPDRPVAPGVRARARTRPATARRSTSARCTSAARTSAASRTRASRTSGWSARATARAMTASGSRPQGAQYGPAPRGMDRFSITVDADGVLTVDTSKITLGPLPGRGRPAGDHPAEEPRRLHMTDETGDRPRSGRPERRAPRAPPASEPVPSRPAERFTAPRQTRAIGGPHARSAPRRSSASRATRAGSRSSASSIVALFVIIYYFYELGRPDHQHAAAARGRRTNSSRSTAVERGYNLYQANCARCHGVNGEGGIGPVLNDQMKLFAHLNEQYLENVLDGRRTVRLRQPQEPHAGLGRDERRAAELPPDRGPDRVHPRARARRSTSSAIPS